MTFRKYFTIQSTCHTLRHMLKRIVAITFIFFCTTVGWAILGSTIYYRSSVPAEALRSSVHNTWGIPQEQKPPFASHTERLEHVEKTTENGKVVERLTQQDTKVMIPLEHSDIDADLQLEYRQKGLLWFSTYKVTFKGAYRFHNTTGRSQSIDFSFPYPASQATYDGVVFMINGVPVANVNAAGSIGGSKLMVPDETVEVIVGYRSQGLDRWTYNFQGQPAQIENFNLNMTTNFRAIDFPENTLSPVRREETPDGWKLNWNYSSLVTSYAIAMEMPHRLQPGPLAGQISYFAPVSLFFFFFLMFIITTVRSIDLHPMNYFFLATAFFAFHLLLSYLVDHVSIHTSFVICSLVSVFLVVSYLRLVVNMRFALVEAAGTQFVFLILFSYAFFFQGFTGLAITIGAIITLFVVMQVTGKVNWGKLL
jgi:inner membrane protein involved in colicin E2 resistance